MEEKLQAFEMVVACKSLKKIAVKAPNWSDFFLKVDHGMLNISRLKATDEYRLGAEKVAEAEFIEEVKSHLCSCFLITRSSNYYRIDITSLDLCQMTQLTFPSFPNLVCPCSSQHGVVHWCYWFEYRKVLKFSQNFSLEIQCSSPHGNHEMMFYNTKERNTYRKPLPFKTRIPSHLYTWGKHNRPFENFWKLVIYFFRRSDVHCL